jgi:hypothetical protein
MPDPSPDPGPAPAPISPPSAAADLEIGALEATLPPAGGPDAVPRPPSAPSGAGSHVGHGPGSQPSPERQAPADGPAPLIRQEIP